jgi:hypothetical protein
MSGKNPHHCPTFKSWLDEKGRGEGKTATAVKGVIANQIAAAMKERRLAKSQMPDGMHTSRARLDPSAGSLKRRRHVEEPHERRPRGRARVAAGACLTSAARFQAKTVAGLRRYLGSYPGGVRGPGKCPERDGPLPPPVRY